MKRILIGIFLAAYSVSVFALKLPNGDNVRVADSKMDGDKILEVTLARLENTNKGPAITTPFGKIPVRNASKIFFYPSGALKEIESGWPTDENNKAIVLQTSIGEIALGYGSYKFYESGSPKSLSISDESKIKIEGIEYTNPDELIEFYDSGSKSVLQPKKIVIDNVYGFKFSYTNKSGSFEFTRNSSRPYYSFYPNGNLKGGWLSKSPDKPAIVNGVEVFIGKSGNTFGAIEFSEEGDILFFEADELTQLEQGGIKFTVPRGGYIWLYKDGKIRAVNGASNISPVAYKFKNTQYNLSDCEFLGFDKNGNLEKFGVDNSDVADVFYDTGKIKREVRYFAPNDRDKGKQDNQAYSTYDGYVKKFTSPIGDEWEIREHSLYMTKTEKNGFSKWYVYDLADNDFGCYIANIYFSDKGMPTSYTLFEYGKNGNYIYDEYNLPIEDSATRKKPTFNKAQSSTY